MIEETKVHGALIEFLKKNKWQVKDVRIYTHPTDNAVTATLYRITETEE